VSVEARCTTYVPIVPRMDFFLTTPQCADVKFNSSAQLLAQDQCVNGTGVGGEVIGNLAGHSATPSGSATPAASSGVASQMGPVVGSGLFAAVVAWGLL
jgi:hypothetical protein